MNIGETPTQLGAQLVAYYQSVMVNQANAIASQELAEQSELRTLQELQYASQGPLLNPGAISESDGGALVRSSMDAHVKKVQASQIQELASQQLYAAATDANEQYLGKKVTVTVHNPATDTVESVWFNRTRGYFKSEVHTKLLHGKIKEVLLDKNALLIEPSLPARLLDPSRKYFIVYVIEPRTLEPAVDITLT